MSNPEWWQQAVSGTCSHGGHGWDGDTVLRVRRMRRAAWLMSGFAPRWLDAILLAYQTLREEVRR